MIQDHTPMNLESHAMLTPPSNFISDTASRGTSMRVFTSPIADKPMTTSHNPKEICTLQHRNCPRKMFTRMNTNILREICLKYGKKSLIKLVITEAINNLKSTQSDKWKATNCLQSNPNPKQSELESNQTLAAI